MKGKKYCSGLDCLTCDEAEPCIYRIANKLQEQLERKEQECDKSKQALDEIEKIVNIDYYQDSWTTLAIKIDNIREIINKTKEK